jgi:hypothetical protein
VHASTSPGHVFSQDKRPREGDESAAAAGLLAKRLKFDARRAQRQTDEEDVVVAAESDDSEGDDRLGSSRSRAALSSKPLSSKPHRSKKKNQAVSKHSTAKVGAAAPKGAAAVAFRAGSGGVL